MESSHSHNVGTVKYISEGGFHKAPLPPQTKEYWEDLMTSYEDPDHPLYVPQEKWDDPNCDIEKLEQIPDDDVIEHIRPALDGFPVILYARDNPSSPYVNRGIYNFNLDKDAPNTLGFHSNPKMMAYEISANSDIGAGAFRDKSWSLIASEFEVRYHPFEANVIDADDVMILGQNNEIQQLINWVVDCVEDNVVATIFDAIDMPDGTPADQFQYYTDMGINNWLAEKGITPVLGKASGLERCEGTVEGALEVVETVTDTKKQILQGDAALLIPDIALGEYVKETPAIEGSRVNVMMGNRFIDAQGITQTLAGKQYEYTTDAKTGEAHWVLPYRTNKEGYRYYAAGQSQQFLNEVREHFNVEYLIDYFIFVYMVGMVDNFGKNLMLHTWDGKIWYPCFYDCDTMGGLDNSGNLIYGPQVDMMTNDYNTSFSKLWTMVQGNFATEIRTRYQELRKNRAFSVENFLKYYVDETAPGIVGERYFNEDAAVKYFPFKETYNHMCNGTLVEWGRRWFAERLVYLDSVYDYTEDTKQQFIVRANKTGVAKLRIKTYSPMYVTVTFSGAQGNYERKLCFKDRWTEFSGLITTSKDNEINVTGAPNLMYVDGIKDLYPSVIVAGNAEKLVEIDCRNSPHLKSVALENNRLLQSVNLSGCVNLGETNPNINVSNSTNLKSLNCAGCSKVSNVVIPDGGSALQYLDLSGTGITGFILKGQAVLPAANFSNCPKLANMTIENCAKMENINMSGNSTLSSIYCVDNASMKKIDVSGATRLSSFKVEQCPELRSVMMQNIISPDLTELRLLGCPKVEEIDITNSTQITDIRFDATFTALRKLRAKNSGLTRIIKGSTATSNSINLRGFNMEEMVFTNCPNISQILNINMYGQLENAFNNCTSLAQITGSITAYGNCTGAFLNCRNLTSLPMGDYFNLEGVQNATSMFEGCSALPKEYFFDIVPKLKNMETNYKMFYDCKDFIIDGSEITADLFANWTKIKTWFWPFKGTGIGLVTVPEGILDNCTELETLRELFPKLTGRLPANLLHKCTKLRNLWSAFEVGDFTEEEKDLIGISEVPGAGFLANCPNLETVQDMFAGNRNMTGSIDNSILSNAVNVTNINGMFRGCSKLSGYLTDEIFKNTVSVINATDVFSGCSSLQSDPSLIDGIPHAVPENLLANMPALQNVSGMFRGCTSLTGQIPAKIFRNNNNLSNVSYFFGSCTRIGGNPENNNEIPDDLLMHKSTVVDASGLFSGCSSLKIRLGNKLFRDCRSLTKINNLFSDCNGLTGTIPADIFTCYEDGVQIPMRIQEASGVFSGCTNLGGSIPETLFYTFTNVLDLSSFFARCQNITGAIPDTLLSKCGNLQNASSMFLMCYGLTKTVVDDDTTFIAEDFFANCPYLENVSSMFSQCYSKGLIPYDLFANNTRLKNIASIFYGASQIKGVLSGDLFRNNNMLEDVSSAFRSCTAITGIESDLFSVGKHPRITSFAHTFDSCSNMEGEVPALWSQYPGAAREGCFANLDPAKISNYNSIDPTWR